MALSFAAIVPHTPILIPAIGKENISLLKKTIDSYRKLEEQLYSSQIDTLLIISPHGAVQSDSFTMNLSPEFNIGFEEFGDLSTKLQIKGDIGSAYKIRERLETKAPLQMISEPALDHGCGVPLFLLTQNNKKLKVIPLYYSALDLDSHFKFGQLLKREFLVNKNRFGIIASGDLSHRLSKNSPAGYSPKGAKFDQKLIDNLKNKKIEEILNMNKNLIEDAGECGLRSIVILLGIISGINYSTETLSYESPFGVGYLTMNFIF
jgi:MEMO1 family protein